MTTYPYTIVVDYEGGGAYIEVFANPQGLSHGEVFEHALNNTKPDGLKYDVVFKNPEPTDPEEDGGDVASCISNLENRLRLAEARVEGLRDAMLQIEALGTGTSTFRVGARIRKCADIARRAYEGSHK